MSFKNALSKMGLIEESVASTKPVVQAKSVPSTPLPSSFIPPAVSTANVDPSIKEMLEQSIQESKLSGFDYLKFIGAVEEMKSSGSSEDARFKMAFVAAKQLGVDKDSLVKSGNHYLDVLKKDEDDFNSDCSEFEKNELQTRDAKIAELDSRVTELTKQLDDTKGALLSLKGEAASKRSSLESRRSGFQATLQSVKSVIETNISKINQYL
jgi:hypothetical protein